MATACRSPESRARPALAVSTSDAAPLARAARSVNPAATASAAASYATMAASGIGVAAVAVRLDRVGRDLLGDHDDGTVGEARNDRRATQRGGWTGGRRRGDHGHMEPQAGLDSQHIRD